MDPCYKKRLEKSLLVAFPDGRLVLTKRDYIVQRWNGDAAIYHATAGAVLEPLHGEEHL